jgi:hypothetical protein
MKQVVLSGGEVTFVDDADYATVSPFSWYAVRHHHGGLATVYAYTRIAGAQTPMHKFLTGVKSDHIDNNGLNNQRSNLRPADQSHNRMNTRKTISPTSSQYKGVCWHKKAQKWMASIKLNKKPIYIGLFSDEQTAAQAYDAKAKILFGEFARLNFTEAL